MDEVAWEVLRCESCGYEFIRATGKLNTLPCGRCKGLTWQVFELVRGAVRVVHVPRLSPVVDRATLFTEELRRVRAADRGISLTGGEAA